MVKDSDDPSYRECSNQTKVNKLWKKHHFAIATMNSADDKNNMLITDMDIDSI